VNGLLMVLDILKLENSVLQYSRDVKEQMKKKGINAKVIKSS